MNKETKESSIAIGCDHVALEFKQAIVEHLQLQWIHCVDYGCFTKQTTDYPLYAQLVAEAVANQECKAGLLFCGTGVGMSIVANKIKGIRAVNCSDSYTAILSKRHNNTNVLTLGSRVLGLELAKMIVDGWLNAEFQGERHLKRLAMIDNLEIKG